MPVLGLLLTWALPLCAEEPRRPSAQQVDYGAEVRPIFEARCTSCHGALKQEAGLRLDTGRQIRQGGDSGPAVVPGNVEASVLIERIRAEDELLRMPPEGERLSDAQIERIVSWVAQGAHSPEDEQPQPDPLDHWAFQTPRRPLLPASEREGWDGNPIDVFIAAEHSERGLRAFPPATKPIVLRRVYLDLIGVPPTRDELHAFLRDDSPDAYERVVDRLLNDPRYGERWGRNWMDVWRYSDWYGRRRVPDVLNSYGQIWRWRDWIIRSLNEDKGYDRMVVEMLAADEVSPADDRNVVATGFIVRNFYRWNYNTWMKDQVEHTGKAFLGLTLNCCHCHDHKYDPIRNEEYFRFRAFFEPIEIRHDRVPDEPDPGVYPKYSYGKSYKPISTGMVRIMDEQLDAETFVYTGGESRNVIPGLPPVRPAAPAFLGGEALEIERVDLPPPAWYPGLKPFVRREARQQAQGELAAARETLAKAEQLVAEASTGQEREAAEWTLRVDQSNAARAEAELAAVEARILADRVRYENVPGDPDEAARAASRAERVSRLAAARVEQARAERSVGQARAQAASGEDAGDAPAPDKALKEALARLQAAQQAVQQAEEKLEVETTDYTPFSHQYPRQSTGRRTALARWITRPSNPLTARVAVNHIWLRHFGRALVETTDNFGRNGADPSHPELLDWMAIELLEQGWRMKPLHRLIVTSRTYRMASSGPNDDATRARDPDNLYLWRFPARRMEAEVVRDSILHVAGGLDATMGGHEIAQDQGLTTPRRSVYFAHHGEGQMQFLDLFDVADPCDSYRRSSSIRPQQALAMVNSRLSVRQARLLARRLSHEDAVDRPPAEFVRVAFERVLSRPPTPAERQASLAFLEKQVTLFRTADPDELRAATDEEVPPATEPVRRARENLIQALFSHHDFLTIR